MSAYPNAPIYVPQKSMILSLVLTFFFGPFGMLYSTVIGALVMLVAYVVVGIPTLGWGIAVLHPIAMAWGAWAVHTHNEGPPSPGILTAALLRVGRLRSMKMGKKDGSAALEAQTLVERERSHVDRGQVQKRRMAGG